MNQQSNDECVDCSRHCIWKADSLHGDKMKPQSNTTFQSELQIDQRPNVKDKIIVLIEECKKYLESGFLNKFSNIQIIKNRHLKL